MSEDPSPSQILNRIYKKCLVDQQREMMEFISLPENADKHELTLIMAFIFQRLAILQTGDSIIMDVISKVPIGGDCEDEGSSDQKIGELWEYLKNITFDSRNKNEAAMGTSTDAATGDKHAESDVRES
jgi:hypothetical protein